jgi:hypothetical protein
MLLQALPGRTRTGVACCRRISVVRVLLGDPEEMAELQARAKEGMPLEKRDWTWDADHWYDGDGNVLLTRGADGWYDPSGVRVYDLNYNRIAQ